MRAEADALLGVLAITFEDDRRCSGSVDSVFSWVCEVSSGCSIHPILRIRHFHCFAGIYLGPLLGVPSSRTELYLKRPRTEHGYVFTVISARFLAGFFAGVAASYYSSALGLSLPVNAGLGPLRSVIGGAILSS